MASPLDSVICLIFQQNYRVTPPKNEAISPSLSLSLGGPCYTEDTNVHICQVDHIIFVAAWRPGRYFIIVFYFILSKRRSVKMTTIKYCSSNLLPNVYQNISCMWSKGELCDVVIETCDGCTVSAHRLVLAAISPYFRVMFTCDLCESRQKVIAMKDISRDILSAIINFAYSSNLEVNSENVESLLMASSLLQIKEIEKVCCDFLRTQLHPSNSIGIWTLAEHHCCRELLSYAFKYILKNFPAVCQSEEFSCLSLNQVKILLNDENLSVNSEEVVYEAALKWIQASNERTQYLAEVMSCIRLPSLKPEFLTNTVLGNELLTENKLCFEMATTALNYALSPPSEKQKLSSVSYKKSRIHNGFGDKLLAIGGLHGGQAINNVEKYDMYTDSWESVSLMPTCRYGVAVAKLHNSVYCLGGCTNGIFLDTCESYDVDNDKWHPINSMPRPLKYLGAAQAHGKIFVVGGTDGFTKQKSVKCFVRNKMK